MNCGVILHMIEFSLTGITQIQCSVSELTFIMLSFTSSLLLLPSRVAFRFGLLYTKCISTTATPDFQIISANLNLFALVRTTGSSITSGATLSRSWLINLHHCNGDVRQLKLPVRRVGEDTSESICGKVLKIHCP